MKAWTEGNHKAVCIVKQESEEEGTVKRLLGPRIMLNVNNTLEGRTKDLPKREHRFLSDLCVNDARKHVDELRRKADLNYPGVPLHEFIVWIDQTVMPPTYNLASLRSDIDVERPPWFLEDESMAEAPVGMSRRSERAIDSVRNNPERLTLLKMIFPVGERASVYSVIVPNGFWESDLLATFTMGE